jgi:hypothetical protein
LLLLFLQTLLSATFYRIKPAITQYLKGTLGLAVTINNASFSFLEGVHLSGLSVFLGNKDRPVVFIEDAYLKIRLVPLLRKRIVLRKIKIRGAILLSRKEIEGINLQIIFSDIYKKVSQGATLDYPIDINNILVVADLVKLAFVDKQYQDNGVEFLFNKLRISLLRSQRLKFRSNIRFTYHIPQKKYAARFLNNVAMIQDLKGSFDGNINGNNLDLEMAVLSLGKERLIGMGQVKDFLEKNPWINISSVPCGISLNNITFLKDNFSPDGYLWTSLRISGLLDNMRPIINGSIVYCSFNYRLADREIFSVKNFMGNFEYKDENIRLTNLSLRLNNLPLNIEVKTNTSAQPRVFLFASLPREFFSYQGLPLEKLEATFTGRIQETLTGDLKIKTKYRRLDAENEMQLNLNNIDFDYYNLKQKYLKAKSMELVKNGQGKTQKLNFVNFSSHVTLNRDLLRISDIHLAGYNGILKADINIDLRGRPRLRFFLESQGLEIKRLMEDMNFTDKLLSGILYTKVSFDNHAKDFLVGHCYLKEGAADLSLLGGNIRLPSLRETRFALMHIYFALAKEIIKIRGVKLLSPDVMLNAYWDTNGKINGALNLKIRTELLKDSEQFRRLINFAGINSPYIDFRFILGGVPGKAMRLMWMKGEFKERIEEALPAGIKQTIENSIDKMIEDLSRK